MHRPCLAHRKPSPHRYRQRVLGPAWAGPGFDGLVLFERGLACWVCGTNKNKTHPDSETLTESCLSRAGEEVYCWVCNVEGASSCSWLPQPAQVGGRLWPIALHRAAAVS